MFLLSRRQINDGALIYNFLIKKINFQSCKNKTTSF
jgi:hypothetical protein